MNAPAKVKYRPPDGVTLRPLACCCTAFSGAVFAAVYLLTGWQMLLLGGLLLFLALALLLRGHPLTGSALLAGMLGMWLVWTWYARVEMLDLRWQGVNQTLTMEAQDYPSPTDYGSEVEVRCTQGELKGVRLRLSVRQPLTDVRPGDLLTGSVLLRSARGKPGPWECYQYSKGILLLGNAREVTRTAGEAPLGLLPRVLARRLADSLRRSFPEQEAGFLLALTISDRSGLTEELDQALTATGLRHIVAASGLHLTILVGAVLLLPGNRRRLCAIALPLLLFYAGVAGFTPSICRAAIMESLLLLAPVLGREEDRPTSLMLALALLLHNPYAATIASLQLSFGAMAGLIWATPRLLNAEDRQAGPSAWLRTSLAASLAANCFTLPQALRLFGSASVLFPLSNLAVLWVLPLLLPLGMLTALMGLLSPALAAPFALVTLLPLKGLIALILLLNRIPLPVLTDAPAVMALLLAGAALMLAGKRVLSLRFRWIALAALWAALLVLALPRPAGDETTVQVLDVGQGQCILLTSGDATAVIDCGSLQHQAGERLTETLQRLGRRQVDTLILTHYDSDHVNGLETLFAESEVRQVCLSRPEEEDREKAAEVASLIDSEGAEAVTVRPEGLELTLGRLTLHLWDVGSGENSGLVILASQDTFDLLVTGDLDMEGENALAQQLELPQVEVLVAGHHGSAKSSGETLLREIAPEAAVFSVGPNSYGHPTQEAMDRCAAAGARLWRTDLEGTITVQVLDAEEGANFQIALAK